MEPYPVRRNIVISTGAGISAESGVHTYRDLDGLWSKYDPKEVCHIDGWKKNPAFLLKFQNELRSQFALGNYQPNAAHFALAKLQTEWKHGSVTIITQNIDGLLQAAGCKDVLAIHGNGTEKYCETCGFVSNYDSDITVKDKCLKCEDIGTTRPHVVMFGEYPHYLPQIDDLLRDCHIFAVIGSSMNVQPASEFIITARNHGADTYLINKESIRGYLETAIEFEHIGNASIEVPNWVDNMLDRYPDKTLQGK